MPLRPLVRGWLFSALGWGIFFLAFGWQVTSTISAPWQAIFRSMGWDWLIWSFLTPLAFRLVNRCPIERIRWKSAVPIHLAVCLATLLILGLSRSRVEAVLPPMGTEQSPPPPRPPLPGRIFFGPYLPFYLLILSAGHALYFYRRGRERELKTVELAASLAEARLRALRMQIQPHFLFNSLNALGTLIHRDTNAADEMLAALGDFLRLTLDDSSGQEVSLRRELEFVVRYLAIEKIRFGERLAYSIEVPPEMHDALVPSLLLQPLIENAVRHGIEPNRDGGRITIGAFKIDSFLHLKVCDDGPGMQKSASLGVGLTNIRERLRELYGESASLHIASSKGTAIEICLPFRFIP